MDRLDQKQDLLVKLGMLLGPMVRLAERASDYDDQERAQTVARYCAEYPTLIHEFHAFSEGQPGHIYTVEYGKFHYALDSIQGLLTHGPEPLEVLVPRSLQVEASPQNRKRVRDHTHHGTELFGPSSTTHG